MVRTGRATALLRPVWADVTSAGRRPEARCWSASGSCGGTPESPSNARASLATAASISSARAMESSSEAEHSRGRAGVRAAVGAQQQRSSSSSSSISSWAFFAAARERLAAELQAAEAEGHVAMRPTSCGPALASLASALASVFRAALLGQSSRRAWARVAEALRLAEPFGPLLAGQAELAPPLLESLACQAHSCRALVSDLDILGALVRVFPGSGLAARPAWPRGEGEGAVALGGLLLSRQEPVFAGLPCPFATDRDLPGTPTLRQPDPVSLQELQRCLGPVGSRVAREEVPWTHGLGLMARTLAADLPTEYHPCAEEAAAAADPFGKKRAIEPSPRKALMPSRRRALGEEEEEAPSKEEPPMTGLQAAETFAQHWQLGKTQFLYLNVAPNRHFRPYDLVAVPKHLINPQHYVFSPYGVLRVHPEEGAEAVSLGRWHQEAVLWQLMQYIPFFRLFLVRKAFVCWFFNVKHLQYLKCCEKLQLQLLQAVPHFGSALLYISSLMQEMKAVHWLPMSRTKCFSYPELQWALDQENSHAQEFLDSFLGYCSTVLEIVRDDTYKMVRVLQKRVQNYKLYLTRESLYRQRVQYEKLQGRLQEAERWLQRLDSLAQLVNFFICQTLVSSMQKALTSFVSCTMKADGTLRKAFLRVQLVFGEESQLVLFPSSRELEDCLVGGMMAVLESVLQTTRIMNEKLAAQERSPDSAPEAGQLPAQLPGVGVVGGSRIYGHFPQFSEALEQLPRLSVAALEAEEPLLIYPLNQKALGDHRLNQKVLGDHWLNQKVLGDHRLNQKVLGDHRINQKVLGGLEEVDYQIGEAYPLLSREQLEKDLHSDPIIQEALAQQRTLLAAALGETELLCREYSWLGEIHEFVHRWGSGQLESMREWPAEEYIKRILKLRTWMSQVQNVPRVVVCYNCLLLVDCSGIHQALLPLLASINQAILALLLSETTKRSKMLITELSGVLQLYMDVGTDIFTVAKCSQKLEQYQGLMRELQERVDYVRALNEVIQQCFRPLRPMEESLENQLLDTWDTFAYQQREVSDFIVSRRLNIIAELRSSLLAAAGELQEILSAVTMGRFQDPAQDPRAMEEELQGLLRHFQATVLRAHDLCCSQRILTGESMDISFVTGQQGVLEVQVRIWQLFRLITEQITEWKGSAFLKFSTQQALEKTEEWQKEVISLEHCVPGIHPILQACLRVVSNFQKYLPLLLKLGAQFLRVSFWKEVFAVMGIKCPLNMQFTVGQLLSYPLLEHNEAILRVYTSEKSRHYARDTLHRLERAWAMKQFRLVNFILNVPYQEPQAERLWASASGRHRPAKLEYVSKDSGTYVLSDTAELKASVEHSILTLQNIILSPFSADLLEEAESWASMLRILDAVLEAWVSFQQKWIFLNIALYEMDISFPSAELDSRFQGVDALFREFMQVTCNDPLVLSCVKPVVGSCREGRFVGASLQATFQEGLGDLKLILRALDYVLESTYTSFPRLFFLSNEELVALMATASEPAEATAWSRRCFPGVRQLQMNVPSAIQSLDTFSAQVPVVQVTGLVGEHQEILKLSAMVPLSRKAAEWLFALEQRMKESIFNLMQACLARRLALRPQLDQAFEQHPGPTDLPLHLVAEAWATLGTTFPAQCVLLAEDALWRVAVEEAFAEPGWQPRLQLKVSLKLEALAHFLRNYRAANTWHPARDPLGLLLGALIILTVQQRDLLSQLLEGKVSSPQAFEWARLLKYHVALSPERGRATGLSTESPWVGSPPGCWADVLNSRLPYDYEYLGPSLRLLSSPALDRTFLGLLLALDEFRCGGLLGPLDTGKSHTVRGLAYALGRQLVTLHCTLQMSMRCLTRHLCGAVHAGALLLLESAERLDPAVLSAFSQRLVDLQRMCLKLQGSRPGLSSAAQLSPASPESEDSESSEGAEGELTAVLPELGTNETEPFQPRVLGNIPFGRRFLRVRETYGCVVTMERLPDVMRLAVRPLAMLPPDLSQLAEVTLLAAGFREATRLAGKLCSFLRLEGELEPGPRLSRPSLLLEVIQTAVSLLFASQAREGDPMSSGTKPPTQTAFFLGLDEEPAVVKALCFSPLLNGPDCPRLQHARELLREIFPSASSQPSAPPAPPRLHGALVAQLHEDKLQPDQELLSLAVLLAHVLQRGTPGVILLGPAGSGKTAIWRTLAKAQSRLAATDAAPGAQGTGRPRATLFRPISTICLWPNGLSVAEFVGRLEGSVWQDGVLSQILQRSASSCATAAGQGEGTPEHWLVLDGSACTEWLEPIASLFGPQPALSLPNGQTLRVPSQVRFLFEMPDASGMPPSVCTHFAILHCAGTTLWRALLSSALAPIYRKYSLTQESLAWLQQLPEELFPPTLAYLQDQGCSHSILLPHTQPQHTGATGVQETTAFTRLLFALLEQYLRRDKVKPPPAGPESAEAKATPFGTSHSASGSRSVDDSVPAHHHKLVQSIFVYAFIWGFGGHLHPRQWPAFDRFARRILRSSSCLTIKLPPVASVFDLCPRAEDGILVAFSGQYLSGRVKGIPGSFSVLPQYERVLFVVDLLLASDQPVLLVGEPGCGKSSFADTLVQPNHYYHRLCLTPALRTTHLRQLLLRRPLGGAREKGLFPGGKTASKGRCLFLVEDLHMAFVDPIRGTSPVVESLRQVLSHQQFHHPDTLELQHCPATGFNCLATLSVPMTGSLPLCPRFGRLFSVVVLPVVTRESLLRMYTGTLLAWLEKFPLLTRHRDLASALIRATADAYEVARHRFQPSPACCCLFRFSLHDVQKVIRGLLLLRPRPGIHHTSPMEDHGSRTTARRSSTPARVALGTGYTTLLSVRLIVRLWLHECLRVFSDRLQGVHQREMFTQALMEITASTFCAKHNILRVIPSSGATGVPLPSHTHHATFQHTSSSGSSHVEEEEEPCEEDLLPTLQVEPDSWHSSDTDCLNPWDPVEQAPPLLLEPPTSPKEPLEEEEEEPEAVAEEAEAEMVARKPSSAIPGGPRDPRATPRHVLWPRIHRRPSSKREFSGALLLPPHLLLSPGEEPGGLVFSKELFPKAFGPNAHNPYQERQWKVLEHQLTPGLTPSFALCSEGLRQVVRLSRLLYGPDRHGALVAFSRGTGRRTLAALVASTTASSLVELPARASEVEALALLRLASWQVGVLGQRVLLLVPSGVSLAVLHLAMALMADGTCPGLYSTEDHISIIQALLQENPSIKRAMRDELILQRFFQFVRSNLHVLLLLGGPDSLALPPLTATVLAQLLSHLEICQPWSQELLVEVAQKHLRNHLKSSTRLTREPTLVHAHKDLMGRLAKAAALIHSSVVAYAMVLCARLPLASPKSFLDFLDAFLLLLESLQERNCKQADRIKVALLKMEEVSKKQQEHARDVRLLQQKLVKIKEQVKQSQREVEREQEVLKHQEMECQMYEARIEALTNERDTLEKGKELAMKKVTRDYRAALAALSARDIEELRSYRQPPEPVVRVTDVLCQMFHQEPSWENAKLLFGREDFYQDLVFYPKDTLSEELCKAMSAMVHEKRCSAAVVQTASQAAASLSQWIYAVYWYYRALQEWQPAMEQLQHCDKQITLEKTTLGDQRMNTEYLRDNTQARIRELKKRQEKQEKLVQQLTQSLQAKDEATTLESSVAEHLVSWTRVTKTLESQHSTLYGDALLCAATLAYLGPFPPTRKGELLDKWQALCAGAQVRLGPDDIGRLLREVLPGPGSASDSPPLLAVQSPLRLDTLLSSPREQRLWDRVHKPKEPGSRLAAMILRSSLQARRWPLLVDPDKQALVWLLMAPAIDEEESEANALSELVPDLVEQGMCEEFPEDRLEVFSLTDPDLDKNLRNAIGLNTPVLLTDFEKNLPWCPTLQQLMQKETLQWPEGTTVLCSSEPEGGEISVDPSFQLYLSTELPLQALVAEVDHELLKGLNVIDLSLSQKAIEDLLLGEVLRTEHRGILKSRQALGLAVLLLEGKLEATEDELVDLISQPRHSLLEAQNFMPMVRLLQTQIQALQANHQDLLARYQDQAALCDKYRQVAHLGGALHQALQHVGRLHPLYRFPAESCLTCVHQALVATKRQDTGSQETLEARLRELGKAVLQRLMVQALPCLRETDRRVFFLLGALATLQGKEQAVWPLEWLAFCGGLRGPQARALLQSLGPPGPPRPDWVEAEAWNQCRLLERLPGFGGLLGSLRDRGPQWQEYFRLPSTVVGPALCPSHAHLTPFQRATLWSILCPSAMGSVMADLTTCLLGWSITEEMAATNPFTYSRTHRPVVFLTAPEGSSGSFTHPLLWIQQMAAQHGRAGKIVVISFGTPDAAERVWHQLPVCTKKGRWLVLSNCHLQERWDPEVLLHLDLLINPQAGRAEGRTLEIHPKFRLWLITAANAPHSVPGPVHRNATIFFCEMPLEVKALLARTHQRLQGQAPTLDTNQRLPLLVLYAALMYRQAFARWTQTTSYLWSQGEVLAGLRVQEKLSRWMENLEGALQELAGTLLYGGHVLDSEDAQAVQSLCQQCLAPAAHKQPGSGLQNLLAAVIGTPSPGLSEEEAAAATQSRIEQLPRLIDPTWVGLCHGLQQQVLLEQSQNLLLALQVSQGYWQPPQPIAWQAQEDTLAQRVGQGLVLVQELQERLARCGWEVGSRCLLLHGQPHAKARPLQRFLLEEAGSLLALLRQVGRDLACLQECLQGGTCSARRCRTILQDLRKGHMPRPWLPYAPTGPQPMPAWLQGLQRRCQLLCTYLASLASLGGQPVAHYQLAAFQHPRRLFLALLQEQARAEKQDVGTYHLDYQLLPTMLLPSSAPEKGIYLSGLELHHGLWNPRAQQIQETFSAKPCPLPPIWVQATRQRSSSASAVPSFQCPVYLGAPEALVPLDSHRMVMRVALLSKMSPELCAQQRVYAVSLLQ